MDNVTAVLVCVASFLAWVLLHVVTVFFLFLELDRLGFRFENLDVEE